MGPALTPCVALHMVCTGAVSLGLCLLFMLVAQLQAYIKYLSVFLTIWWLCGLLALTMPGTRTNCEKDTYCNGVFLVVNNGFLGCWAALCFSAILAGETMGGEAAGMMGGGGGGGGDQSTHKEPEGPPEAPRVHGSSDFPAPHASEHPVV